VKGDPFQPPLGKPQRFVNATFNPDFRVSGEQMVRATPAFFGRRTDGVVAIDVVALSKLLEVIGPISSEYGELTSENLVDELLVKSYSEAGGDVVGRQARNEALMSTMLSSLMEGGQLKAKMNALLAVAPSRHVQAYFRDDRLQHLVEDRGLAGAVPNPRAGNMTAVFTQNGNGSKVDVFQQRTISQVVEVHEDGSAKVSRTVRIENATPPYTGPEPDPKFGYFTRWATNLVINVLPRGAKVVEEPTTRVTDVERGRDQVGRTFAQAAVTNSPGETVEVSWAYRIDDAVEKVGDAWRFKDLVVPQNTVNTEVVATTVLAPEGWTTRRVDDSQLWYTANNMGMLQIPVSTPTVFQLDLVPPAS
jgi:hypothetical protein